ncbi:MAG: efflux RND transporter periplasmic adaptor subunit, partial [Cyanophyceae cyanobacterium]
MADSPSLSDFPDAADPQVLPGGLDKTKLREKSPGKNGFGENGFGQNAPDENSFGENGNVNMATPAAGEEIDLEEEEEFGGGGVPWLMIGAAIALMALTGGALWWQQSQAEGDRGAMTASTDKPPVGVSVAPVRSAAVTDTSDFVGTLRAVNRVTFRAETEGRIVRIFTRSGQPIRVNQPLFQIEPREQEAAFGGAQANIASVQAAVQAAQAAAAQERAAVAAAGSRIEALKSDYRAKEAELNLAKKELERVRGLVETGVLAEQLLDRAVGDRDRIQAELEAIEERIKGAAREQDGARLRGAEAVARLRGAEAELGRSQASAVVERERLRETQV